MSTGKRNFLKWRVPGPRDYWQSLASEVVQQVAAQTPMGKLARAVRPFKSGKAKSKARYTPKATTNKKWGTIAPSKSSIAMYKLPRTAHFKNYRLEDRATIQHIVLGGALQSSSYTTVADNMVLLHQVSLVSHQPVKVQSGIDPNNEMIRVGDAYSITDQQMRICIEGGTNDTLKQKGFCCRLIILEFDFQDYAALAFDQTTYQEYNWSHLMDKGEQTHPEITTWFRDSTRLPFPKKFKVFYDKSMKLGTDGSNIEEIDLTIRFPQRKITFKRDANLETSVPVSGKIYGFLFVHDGPGTDIGPRMKFSVRTQIRD